MRALVSTSDKTGLLEFLKPLVQKGLEVVSTGGTYEFLKKNDMPVVDVSEVTHFPEVLDGRVKTLHPFVHMGLLADKRNPEHLNQLKEHKVKAFDMVIGNLYPFEKTALTAGSTFEDLIENIDIGGPSFLRASAKNFHSVIVVASPNDYAWVQEKILSDSLTVADRKKLALKVFSLTAYYDSLIVSKLCDNPEELEYLNLPLKKKASLRYGENAQQKAQWYADPLAAFSLADAVIHQGKELSYNNLLDLDAALALVRLFEKPACVAVKHNNPCGAAQDDTLFSAVDKAIQSDPKSIFGGIVAFNRPVDLKTCELFKDIFLECVVAPEFSPESLSYLATKKNLRVLTLKLDKPTQKSNFKSLAGGALLQAEDSYEAGHWDFIGEKPDERLLQDMRFTEKVAGALKSNAIALSFNGQTVGLGMGQVNRVDAVQQALLRLKDSKTRMNIDISRVVLASDAFFPFPDSIELLAQQGIKWIVQPGGSVQDEKVIEAVKENRMNMALTKRRHFKH